MQSSQGKRVQTEKEISPKKKRDVDREKANKRETKFFEEKNIC